MRYCHEYPGETYDDAGQMICIHGVWMTLPCEECDKKQQKELAADHNDLLD